MRAIRLDAPGGLQRLVLEQIEMPSLRGGDVLVRVLAAAITRDELTWPVDRLPAIPSYELSGVIEGVAPEVTELTVGDAVYGLTPFDRDGAAAEYAAVPAAALAPKPTTLDGVHAAALPLAGLSAWQGLFDHGGLEASQRVLIHGGAGGVGHLAVQLARRHGAHVVATASPPAPKTFADRAPTRSSTVTASMRRSNRSISSSTRSAASCSHAPRRSCGPAGTSSRLPRNQRLEPTSWSSPTASS
jgi:NADPH:quinone reductase-like Zn-dependent oxidoreductase